MPAKAPPVLKFRKSPTGTKHTINRRSVKPIIGEGYYLELNKGTPKAKEWTPKQLEKLKKIGKENARIRKSQNLVIERRKYSTNPGKITYKNERVFHNLPVSEIRLDSKIGMMVFTGDYQGRPKQYRITRKELLTNDYYKEVGLFNNLLESRKYSFEESSASVKKRIETKKQKVIDVVRFLKIKNLKSAGITIESLIDAKFTLPEIILYGGYSPIEISTFFTPEQINSAHKYNYNNKSKFDRNKDNFR